MSEDQVFAKCARRLIPFAMLLYVVNYIDRVNVGFAALTMNKDLGFSPAVYGLGGSIFFVGYLIFQVPANLILERLGARRWIFLILAVWGLISTANALIQGPNSYYTMRFILGVAEAGFFPGMLLYMTYWFPKGWRARFVAGFMAAIPLANIVGAPLSSFILQMDGIGGLRGWQWMFIIEGLPACVLAFAALKMLPDRPANADWLSDEEKALIANRLSAEDTSEHRDLWPAFRDPRVYAIGLILLGNQCALYGVQLWLPLIVQGMGYSILANGFIVASCFIAGMIAMVLWGRHSDARNERIVHVALPLLLAAGGLAMAASVQGHVLVLLALAITLVGTLSYNGPFFSLPSTFLAGTAAAGGIGLVNTIGSFGRVIGPSLVGFFKQETGGYGLAMAALSGLMLMAAVSVLVLGRLLNQRRHAARLPVN